MDYLSGGLLGLFLLTFAPILFDNVVFALGTNE